jgi:hypothetical protein
VHYAANDLGYPKAAQRVLALQRGRR